MINKTLTTDDEFNKMYEVYTLDEVLREIRDERARQFLNNVPYELQSKSAPSFVDKNDLIRVENFSKDTGDFNTLSQVDILVIAMGLTVAR